MSEEQSRSGPASAGLRASDADRERLIAELNEHTVEGRLSTDEFEQRVQAVYAARTITELDTLRRDLPETMAQRAQNRAARRSLLTRRLVQETGGSMSVFAVCTAIWLVSGAQGQFWPVWVLIVVVMSLGRSAWALFGPAPDLDAAEQHLDRRRERRLERDQRRGRRRLGP
jgi:Domain of unknown function (DUF1707)